MNEIISSAEWSQVRLLEKNELARGGINGNMNEQAIALANRTLFLKELTDELKNEVARLTELVENCNCTGGSDGTISVGISPDLQYQDDLTERNIHWAIELNGELYPTEIGSDGEGYSYLEDYLQKNKENLGITGEYVSDDADAPSGVYIRSITNTRKFVRLIPDAPYAHEMKLIGNPSAKIDSEDVISFWLEANNEVIEPEPEPEPWPELGDPVTFIASGLFYLAITTASGTVSYAIDHGDGKIIKYRNTSAGVLQEITVPDMSVVKLWIIDPVDELLLSQIVALTEWGDTPISSFILRTIEMPEYTARQVPTYLPTYVKNTSGMFNSAVFNDDINMWDVSNVENMKGMFAYNSSFNKPLNFWNVRNVKDMKEMFRGSVFNQDISGWCVPLITSEPSSFSGSALVEEHKPRWGTCPNG